MSECIQSGLYYIIVFVLAHVSIRGDGVVHISYLIIQSASHHGTKSCDAVATYTDRLEFWVFLHLLMVFSQLSKGSPPHLCCTTSHVLCRTIPSTPLSCLTSEAKRSVRASRGKNLPEYGSNRSSTTRSRSCSFSSSLIVRSGSSGSGLAATKAQ